VEKFDNTHKPYWEEKMMPGKQGKPYEKTVPDTLDLVERAEYAINAMTGALDAEHDYEYIWRVEFAPLKVIRHAATWWDSNPRAAWTLPLMRIMTGSSRNLDLEENMVKSMLSRVGEDGLLYNAPYRPDAPWRKGGIEYNRQGKWRTDEDVSCVHSAGLLLSMFAVRYQLDQDPTWLKMGEKTLGTLVKIAIYKDDYVYYPATNDTGLEFAYYKKSGWPDTKEAKNDLDSPEGDVLGYIGIIVYGLCRWHKVTNDARALELARKLVNYMLKPCFWGGNIESWAKWFNYGYVRGHGGRQRKPAALFKAHQAAMTYTLQGLIEYGLTANDAYVKEWVRQAYEYYRNLGIARLGMWGENIANNMMAVIAIKLCDAGVGDYYEDVDQYVRNAMVEDQFIDAELLKKGREKQNSQAETADLSVERFLGSLNWVGICDWNGTLDPTHNFVSAAGPYLEPFYFTWESIVRYQQETDTAHVNLLLNRVSSWLDLESHLPYQGKVVLRNKTARTIAIRIPRWVDRKKITCRINQAVCPFAWVGNYLTLFGLAGTETITVEFPMVETTETYYLVPWELEQPWYQMLEDKWEDMPTYILHFKGNTCVKAEFPNREKFLIGYDDLDKNELSRYPIYRREHYRKDKAPIKIVKCYIAPRLVSV
jgi:hypothetical protein